MDRDLWLRLVNETQFHRLDMVLAVDRQHPARKVMGEDLHYVMDRDLWLRLVNETQFHRLDMVVAVDRQHPARKVMGQQAKAPLRPLLNKAINVGFRLRGLTKIPSLATTIDPAFDLHFDRVPEMAFRQALVPRSSMPID